MSQANKKRTTPGLPPNRDIISQIQIKNNDTVYRWFICYANFGCGRRFLICFSFIANSGWGCYIDWVQYK